MRKKVLDTIKTGQFKIAKQIIDKEKVDVKEVFEVGKIKNMTLLHYALCRKNANLDFIKYLVETKGASVNQKGPFGRNAIAFACRNLKITPEIITYLLEKGSRIEFVENQNYRTCSAQKKT